MTLHIDFETRSTVDLKKQGVYVYAEDPTTDVWCAAYAVDDGPVQLWRMGEPCPTAVKLAVLDGDLICAHNAAFERIIWRDVLAARHGWPVPALEQWRCTMVRAYALALPGSLENAAAAVGMTEAKDMEGHRLMMQMAKPRRREKDGTLVWWDDDDRLSRLYAYCKQDVETERALDKRLLDLRPAEWALYHFDQRVNDRGIRIDVKACHQVKHIIADARDRCDAAMKSVTAGEVPTATQVAELAAWIDRQGIPCKSVAKAEIDKLLDRVDLPDNVRKALEIRRQAGKASTAKITAMLNGANHDGRSRGLLQFHAASTGRWGGRRLQPQNLPRPDMPFSLISKAFGVFGQGIDAVDILLGNPLHVVSNCLRSFITAAPGHELLTADFSAIEARVIAWLAGADRVLDVFRSGADIYCHEASGIYGRPINKKDNPDERQVGKVAILALGYEGGIGAFSAMARGYGVDMAPVCATLCDAAPPAFVEEARDWSAQWLKINGPVLTPDAALASDLTKRLWRANNPEIVEFWRQLEDAAAAAIENPGSVQRAGRYVKYRVSGSWLFCLLPAGRTLAYAYPRLEWKKTPWGADKRMIVFKGVDSMTKQWKEQTTYGGSLAENVTQATARDLLAEGMLRVEAAGYPIVMHVHDEAVAEVPAGTGNLHEFETLLSETPAWAAGCPVTAEGWRGERYRKG